MFCVTSLAPLSTQAAVSAVKVTDNAAIFAIKFDFIAGKEAYRIPIGAQRGLPLGSDSNFIGYDVKSGSDSASQDVITSGLVLSTAPIADGLYYEIAPGERASFTFVSVATVPEAIATAEYQASLTHIPHFIGDSRTEVSESRLGNFVSAPITLNREISGPTFILKTK